MRQVLKIVHFALFTLLLMFVLSGCGSSSTRDIGGDAEDNNSTVIDDNNNSTVIDDNNNSTIIDDNNNSTVIDDNNNSTVIDDNNNSTVIDENNNSTVIDDNNNSTVIDDDNNSTVIDDDNNATVIDDDNNATVIDDNNNSTVIDDNNNSTVIDDNNNSTVIDDDNNSTVIDDDNNSTVIDDDNNSTVIDDDNNSTVIDDDNNSTVIDDDNNSTETDNNTTITGQVIDGEISGAIVFLDLNKDSEFDSTEPNTVTKTDGTYTLILTTEDKKHKNYLNRTAPLVAYGGKDIRTDEIFEDYLMSMIEDKENVNITPFTTLIAQSLEEESNEKRVRYSRKTNSEVISELAEKIAQIKKNLAELFGLNESILDKNPIQLAKEGDNSLLSQSLQLHKSAKAMKKAMKGDVKSLKRSILKSYKSLGRELKKLKRDALKNDKPLLKALDTAMNDSKLFDSSLVKKVKEEAEKIVVTINDFWKGQKGTLTDNALTDAIKEGNNETKTDTTKPIITLLGESTISLIEGTPYSDAGATATDDIDGDLSSAITVNSSVNVDSVGSYTVIYNVSDSSGNSAVQVTRTVEVTPLPDTIKPVITLIGSSTITLTKGTAYTDAGATASDEKDGDLTSTIQVNNSVDITTIGSYTVTYDVSDSAGNSAIQVIRTVTVNPIPDIIKPIITLSGSSTITLTKGTTYSDAGATATDDIDGDISSKIQINNSVNTNISGTYSITYNVSDTAGNQAIEVTRTVTVSTPPPPPPPPPPPATDSTKPIITLIGDVTVNVQKDTNYTDAGATADDNKDGNITANIVINSSLDINRTGIYTITYDVNDSSGNSAVQVTRTVNVTTDANVTVSRANALKFLRQASFRTNEDEIAYIMANGYEIWIENQFAMVGDLDNNTDTKYGYLESTLRTMNRYNSSEYPLSVVTDPTTLNEDIIDGQRMDVFRDSVFWEKAIHNENQLRQRVTYALSQILVVADDSPAGKALSFRGESVINYYDILYKHSFGNYRNLLTDITHSSAMGYFLTYIGSKAEAPDENYARELTQLFTVGLYELNDDGTKLLDGGNPTPSYDQQHVTDLSKVFTGWGLDDLQGDEPRYGATAKTNFSWVSPLKFFPQYHDNNSTLDLLGSATMSTSPDGSTDIENALDILFANHNVAPFISRHLIMRLVTSNPTPAYVGRVASVFNNNGAGVKGDLKAVVKAILLDPEARGSTVVPNFGKVDEMPIAFSHFLSQFKARPAPKMSIRVRVSLGVFENRDVTNMYWINPQREFGQTVLGAPSVFNFYSNEFIPSSAYFAQNSLVAPELELQNIPNLIGYSNLVEQLLTVKDKYVILDIDALMSGSARYESIEDWADNFSLSMGNQALYLDLTEEYNLFEKALDNEVVANNDFASLGEVEANDDRTRAVNALLEHLDNKLFGGTMPQAYKDALFLHTESFDYPRTNRGRAIRMKSIVPTIVRAIITSPLFMVLK